MELSPETAAPFSTQKKGNQLITDRQYTASHWQPIKCISTAMKACILDYPEVVRAQTLLSFALISSETRGAKQVKTDLQMQRKVASL